MTLHIEAHTVAAKGRGKPHEALLLVTDTGIVIATFHSPAAARLYTEQISLTWRFARETGRLGL